METLKEVESQLSGLVSAVQRRLHPSITVCVASKVELTQILIHIERLGDELRSATRSLVTQAQEYEKEELNEKAVSNSDTEEEEGLIQETEEERKLIIDKKRVKEDDKHENATKRQKIEEKREGLPLESQLEISTIRFKILAEKALRMDDTPDVEDVQEVLSQLAREGNEASQALLTILRNEVAPADDVVTGFHSAVVKMPAVIARHYGEMSVGSIWTSITYMIKRIVQIPSSRELHPNWPAALSDSAMEAAIASFLKLRHALGPDLIGEMESWIQEKRSEDGALEPNRIGKPLGHLTSLFYQDCKICTTQERLVRTGLLNPPFRTEERWKRFAAVGEVLADWLQIADKATITINVPGSAAKFSRQLKGFAKHHRGRVPAILLENVELLAKVKRLKAKKTTS